jgi:hypothetical protein
MALRAEKFVTVKGSMSTKVAVRLLAFGTPLAGVKEMIYGTFASAVAG